MTFWRTVRAYLTGWLIVQPIYNRVYNAWRRREMEKPEGEYRTHLHDQACAIVDVMEARGHLVRPVRQRWTRTAEEQRAWLQALGERIKSHGEAVRAASAIAAEPPPGTYKMADPYRLTPEQAAVSAFWCERCGCRKGQHDADDRCPAVLAGEFPPEPGR